MGMFDRIIVDSRYPLPMPDSPRGFIRTNEFQSKDLGSCMDEYKIDENGKLFIFERKIEYGDWTIERLPNGEDVTKHDKDKVLHEKWVEVPAYDTIHMYDSVDGKQYTYWIEYRVQFVNGTISDITLFRFTVKDKDDGRDDILKRIFGQEKFDNE